MEEREFEQLEKVFETRSRLVNETFPEQIKLIKRLLQRSFYYIEFLQAFLGRKAVAAGKMIMGPKAMPLPYFQRNTHYLYGAFLLCEKGLVNQVGPLLRTVMENIIESYIYVLGGDEAELLFKKRVDTLTPEEAKIVKKEYMDFKAEKIRQLLYNNETRDKLRKYSRELSDHVHAGIKGSFVEVDPKPFMVEDRLKIILALETLNLIAISEAHYNDLPQDLITKTNKLLEDAYTFLGFIPSVNPDKGGLKSKLRFNLDSLK